MQRAGSTTPARRAATALLAGAAVIAAALAPVPVAALRLSPAQAAVVNAAEDAVDVLRDEQLALVVLAEAEALEAVWQGGKSELDRLERDAAELEQTADAVAAVETRIKNGATIADLQAVEEAVFTARGLLAGRLRGVDVARLRPAELVVELRGQAAAKRELIAGVESGLGVRPDIDAIRAAAGDARQRVQELLVRLAGAVGDLAWADRAVLAQSWAGLSPQRLLAVTFALAQIGKPYVFASQGPRSYDCSGLTTAAWKVAGRRLTSYSFAQKAETIAVAPQDMLPGDLIFWDRRTQRNRTGPPGHVAMFIGGGYVVEATGAGPVRVGPYKTSYLAGYGHVQIPGETWAPTVPAPRIVPRP